jgi:hypothetical protein
MPGIRNSKTSRLSETVAVALCFLTSAAVMAAAIAYFYKSGATLYSGDAEAHLNIARRVIESRTPGWSQLGTTWLPLPHLLMIPLVRNDWLWTSGLAGAFVSGAAMALAATFLFASLRMAFGVAAASVGAAVFLLNPNTLYLGSVPMSEPVFFASVLALLCFTMRFGKTQGWMALIAAALAAFCAALTRYEAWFLLPFAAIYILISGRRRRWVATAIFCVIAALAPVLWFAHNRYYFGDPLYFYRGPWSALAIQGKASYPGNGNWPVAVQYFFAAGQLIAGWPALLLGAGGIVIAALKKAFWPLILLALPVVFYVWSIHSSGTPIYVRTLWPYSWYNVRYGMVLLPLAAVGVAALVDISPLRFRVIAALVATAATLAPFVVNRAQSPAVWQEAFVNSRARRQWISDAAAYLQASMGPHETFFTSFGDLTAIYRTLDIPLRDTLTGDNDVEWDAAVARPDLFLHSDWAVVMGGDAAQGVIERAWLAGPRYQLVRRVTVKGAPAIEIYKREIDKAIHEDPIHETARREE